MPDLWQHGPTIGVLAILLASMWQSARFFAPRFDRVVERHIQFVDALEKKFETVSQHIESQTETMDRLIAYAEAQEKRLERLEAIALKKVEEKES